ncbi:Apc15p protein-domain-containing protein [Annulohypoxylon truncatum]|uniref:Apc15p protein-domain-containing protein n=1 Tax=Annulohypoxylon truncatum TaxID=327061 RepID=UPI00200869E3|nr:Apc15p protein-domain-containing protein [Annulohypoxylon truncatum]KAI1210341.1 Apc15p protein-domain-containing protein [Annulohypoxylon truncatum]
MLSLLPDLAPRDVSQPISGPSPPTPSRNLRITLLTIPLAQSHALWYTSPRNPLSSSSSALDASAYPPSPLAPQPQQQPHDPSGLSHRRGAHLLERSPLARLRADEQTLERRRANVTNFGAAWLKPPGIPKTLHQLREERREAEEHAEALRREQLAQELAEAEAAGGAGGVDALVDAQGEEGEDGDGVMDDVQLDGARDLDEDIPEADDFGVGSGSEEDDDEEDEDSDDDSDEDDDDDDDPEQRAAHAQQQLMAQRMRQADDAFRESVARGRDGGNYYGVDDEVDDEDQAQMIEEDDLIGHGDGGDMDMDGDLDDEIPEAEDAGYEHTDSEADLSSEDDGDEPEMSFAAQVSQPSRYRHSLARSDATRHSLAISDILSHDESSMLHSSPEIQRRRNSGPARRGRG